MMNNVYDFRLQQKRYEGAIAAKDKDYSRYKFRFDAGALQKDDTEIILVLLSTVQTIPWIVVQSQIESAIEHNQLKEWIIQDVLMEANEVFFDNYEIVKTMKNIYSIDENLLVDSFDEILRKVNY
ncbi:MAG: hypothetical protein APF81_17805 [Desulfosporosinus sp. BRH_c37]|nr:MAG: hypothetical protein APF81_17805 [Desulfosporosinus sp. BRH_c37]